MLMQNVILPKFGTTEDESPKEHDKEYDHAETILVGFGRFGHPIIRLLRSIGRMPTVLEKDSDHVDFIRRLGMKCYYGDATRLQLLQAAGAGDAKLLIIAIDDESDCLEIIETCRKHFPHLKLFARACSRNHANKLHEAGVEFFIEQLGSSLDCAIAALSHLGHDLGHSKDAARIFKETEIKAIERTTVHQGDEKRYRDAAQQNLKDLESLLENAPIGQKGER